MRQIKAFIHPHRIGAVTEALRSSGLCDISTGTACQNITVSNVMRLYSSGDNQQHYSVAIGEPVIGEIKLELFCEDQVVDQLAQLIADAAKPGTGWVFVSPIEKALRVL